MKVYKRAHLVEGQLMSIFDYKTTYAIGGTTRAPGGGWLYCCPTLADAIGHEVPEDSAGARLEDRAVILVCKAEGAEPGAHGNPRKLRVRALTVIDVIYPLVSCDGNGPVLHWPVVEAELPAIGTLSGYVTPSGKPVYHPNAYRRAFGRPVYIRTSRVRQRGVTGTWSPALEAVRCVVTGLRRLAA